MSQEPAEKRVPTTVYLNPKLARAAKIKAALTDQSLSDIVNEAIFRYLNANGAEALAEETHTREAERAFEDLLSDLKKDGLTPSAS